MEGYGFEIVLDTIAILETIHDLDGPSCVYGYRMAFERTSSERIGRWPFESIRWTSA